MVVAGAGARGAYEAGALGSLVPRMEQARARPTIFVGPPSRDSLGQLAGDVYDALRPRPLRLRSETRDIWLLRQLLANERDLDRATR